MQQVREFLFFLAFSAEADSLFSGVENEVKGVVRVQQIIIIESVNLEAVVLVCNAGAVLFKFVSSDNFVFWTAFSENSQTDGHFPVMSEDKTTVEHHTEGNIITSASLNFNMKQNPFSSAVF